MPTPYDSEEQKRRMRDASTAYNREPGTDEQPALRTPIDETGIPIQAPATGGEPATAAPAAPQAPATAATGDGGEEEYGGPTHQIKSMEDAIALMRQRRDEIDVEDAEKRQQRERRESARSFIGSVADMGRALANLHYTTQYAPSQTIGEGLSGKYRELYETKAKERDKNRALWDNYNAQLRKLEEAKGGTEAALDAAKQAQANWKAEQEAKAREAEANRELKREEMEAKAAENQANRENAQAVARTNAQGRVNAAVAGQREKNKAGGSNGKPYHKVWDVNGEKITFTPETLSDYNFMQIFLSTPNHIRRADGTIDDRPEIDEDNNGMPTDMSEQQMYQWIIRSANNPNYEKTRQMIFEISGHRPKGGNTPQSRRNQNNSNNTPPSRRK